MTAKVLKMSQIKEPKVNQETGEVLKVWCIGRTDGYHAKGQVFASAKDEDIVNYGVDDVVEKVGEGEHDYVIKKKVVEVRRVNRAEFINSHRNDVGILNILKKCALAGQDPTDGRFASEQGFVDLSKMPKNVEEAYAAVEKGVSAFDKLPEDMKKKMSMEAFVHAFGAEEIENYVKEHMPAKAEEPKVEAPKGEA